MPEKTTFRDSALRAAAVIGLIAILVLGAWGIIQLVVGLPDFFSNIGSSAPQSQTVSGEQLTLNAPSVVTSGQPFPLSWTHTGGSGNYSFTISYACESGLTFAAPVPTGQYQQVACNTPFNYTSATGNVQLIAVLANTQKQENAQISVSAVRLSDSTITATGTSTLTVLPALSATGSSSASRAHSVTRSTGSTYTPSGKTSNLYGSPDLAVQILSTTPQADGRYAIRFEVSNIGTNVAPFGWEFQAQLPTIPSYTFVSQPQQKLYPGDKIVYTLGFTMPSSQSYPTPTSYPVCGYNQNYTYNGYYTYPTGPTYNCTGGPEYTPHGNAIFSVIVDPQYLINDPNHSNNTASITFSY